MLIFLPSFHQFHENTVVLLKRETHGITIEHREKLKKGKKQMFLSHLLHFTISEE